MDKIIKTSVCILFLFLSVLSYGAVIYVSDEQDLQNIFTMGVSTTQLDVLVVPPSLLQNLSDENAAALKKLYKENKIEFAGTSYTEVILPVLFSINLADDAKKQVEKGMEVYSDFFGSDPTVFYPYMGIISKDVVKMLGKAGYSVVLTSAGTAVDLKSETNVAEPDLSGWTSSPLQKLAWNYVVQARTQLAEYAHSRSYDSKKSDAAYGELYGLEKPIWFENYVSNDEDKKNENDLWFRAGLSNIYRLIGSAPPASLSVPLYVSVETNPVIVGATGEYTVFFPDDKNNTSLSTCTLSAFGVRESTGEIIFDIFASSLTDEVIDVYIVLNRKSNTGNTAFINGHKGFTDSVSEWQYAVSVSSYGADFYRYSRTGPPVKLKTFEVNIDSSTNVIEFAMPESDILGNPKNWGYIVAGFLPSGDVFHVLGYVLPEDGTVIQVPALRSK